MADVNIIDLYERKVSKMDDEQLRSEIKVYLVALGFGRLTPEDKIRTIAVLKEGVSREGLSANHNDFEITLKLLKWL